MAFRLLLTTGLIAIPFWVIPGCVFRKPSMELALGIAIALGLLALSNGKIKPFKNIWLLILVAYLLVSTFFAPKPDIKLCGMQVHNFWAWKPLFHAIVFTVMLIAVSSADFTKKNIKLILNVMVGVGCIMSLYVIAQYFGIEQWCVPKSDGYGRIGGTLGNPCLVAPFIAMIVPIALYLRKWVIAAIMAVAVILTTSQVALGAMIVSLLFYFGTQGKKRLILTCTVFLVLGTGLCVGYHKSDTVRAYVADNHRFKNWSLMYKDLTEPLDGINKKFSLTGIGAGCFPYTYQFKHPSRAHGMYKEAHNEYAELAYDTGFIGLGLFLMAIFYMIRQNFSFKAIWGGRANRYRMCLMSSFVCIAVAAGGIFCWHTGPVVYYSLIVCGLLSQGGKEDENVENGTGNGNFVKFLSLWVRSRVSV